MPDLGEELAQDCAFARRRGSRNRHYAFACLSLALLGSLAGTIATATDLLPKYALAIIAAIPGTALLANSVFRFDSKASWWWTRYHLLRGLRYQLVFEGKEPKEVSAALRSLALELEKTYPGFGTFELKPQQQEHVSARDVGKKRIRDDAAR